MTPTFATPLTWALLCAAQFAFVTDKAGVRVSRRTDTRAIELVAEGEIAAPPDEVRGVLLDYAHHPGWVRGLKESRVLQRGDHFVDVYQRLDLPVIDDRDFTLHVTWQDVGPVRWLRFVQANDRGPPPQRGAVRVALHEGSWQLEPTDGGRATRATYHLRLDLAGSLPGWMARGRAAEDLPAFFEALRRQLHH
jgi:hypothetical protein